MAQVFKEISSYSPEARQYMKPFKFSCRSTTQDGKSPSVEITVYGKDIKQARKRIQANYPNGIIKCLTAGELL